MEKLMNRKMIMLWSLYDFATTPVAFAINAMYLPLMIIEAGGSNSTVGILPLITGVVASLWTPIIGALIDRSQHRSVTRKIIVTISVLIAGASIVAMTMMSGLLQIVLLFITMTLGVQTGWTAMNAYLAQEGADTRMGTTSATGVMMGYLGGAIGAGGAVLFEKICNRSIALIFIGAFLIVFGLLSGALLRERTVERERPKALRESLMEGVHVVTSDTSIKAYLIGAVLWGDGVATIVTFASLLVSDVLQIPTEHITLLLAIAVPSALIGAILHGRIGDRFGLVRVQGANLCVWAGGIATLIVLGPLVPDLLVAIVAGLALGGNMAISRALYARIIPEGVEARLFGIAAIFTFFGGSIGPLLTGLIADLPGMSLRTALIVPLLLLIIGMPTLKYIKVNSGPFQGREPTD
ncbi:MAG: MFS transporter [Candidatus Thorarchaeota archaeon]|nr:MFS transporter [Candidatus Thorarchaeota archaeon]